MSRWITDPASPTPPIGRSLIGFEVQPPRTRADIPAGQGAASLFLRSWTLAGRTRVQLVYKREDGTLSPQIDPAGPDDAVMALLEHLAATLPTVTEETG